MSLVRIALIAGIAIATLTATWFAWAFTAGMVMVDPEQAYNRWHTDTARTRLASQLVTDKPTLARAARAIRLGTTSLARTPVDAEAARDVAFGQLAWGNYAQARAIIRLSEGLSRRDLVAQTWLIEDRAAAGDIVGAVQHYDRALRTVKESRPILLPVLAQATDDPAVATVLARRLASRPEWWSDFLGRFVAIGTSPVAFRLIADGLRLNPAVDEDRVRLGSIFARLARLGKIAQARALFDRFTRQREGFVVDGGFEHDSGMLPFGWQLVEDTDRSAVREPREGAHGTALSIAGTAGGQVARQLLALPPGHYVLRGLSGGVLGGVVTPPLVSLACVHTSEDIGGTPEIVDVAFPVGAEPHRWAKAFTVPVGCAGQWLRISSATNAGYTSDNPWIDDISIVPMVDISSQQH
jgi:hypothetical protein